MPRSDISETYVTSKGVFGQLPEKWEKSTPKSIPEMEDFEFQEYFRKYLREYSGSYFMYSQAKQPLRKIRDIFIKSYEKSESKQKYVYKFLKNEISDIISKAINESQKILELEEDWDEEGSKSYKKETWIRVTDFLKNEYDIVFKYIEIDVSSFIRPRIYPGVNGSIDVVIDYKSRRILINFPEDSSIPAGFYGRSKTKNEENKGKFPQSKTKKYLLLWLYDTE